MAYLDLGSIGYSLELKKDGSWDSGIKSAEKNLQSLGAAMAFNQKELDKLQKEMLTTSAKMRQLESTTGKTSKEYQEQAAKLETLKAKYKAVDAATDDFRAGMAKAGATSRITAEKFGADAKKMGSGFVSAGRTMTMGITLPILGMSALAVKLGSDFESTMNQVQASTSSSADEMEGLRALALKMGADTVFSAGQAGDAMLELSKAGMTPAQVKAGALESALLLAAAGGLELGDAATVTASSLKQFNLPAEDAARVANALAGGANASIASVDSLRQSLAQGGSVAAAYGQSINGTVGGLALLADKGMAGSDAGTSLKSMFLNLIPQTDKQTAAFDKLGLSFVNGKGEFDDITVIAQKLQDKLGGLTEAQRNSTLETIFGSDAMRAAIILTGAGADGVQTYVDATLDQAAASDMANARMKGMSGAMENMKGSVETAAISFGSVLAPVVYKLSEIIKGLADKFTALTGSQKNTALQVVVFAAVLGPIVALIGYAVVGVGALASAIEALSVATGLASGGITIVLGAIALLTAAGVAGAVGGMDGLSDAARDLKDAQNAAATAARNHKDALDELAGKTLDRREATLNLADANSREADAQDRLTALVKNGKKGTKEYADALRDLARSKLDQERSTVALTTAIEGEHDAAVKAGETNRKEAAANAKIAATRANEAFARTAEGKAAVEAFNKTAASSGRAGTIIAKGALDEAKARYVAKAAAEVYRKASAKANDDVAASQKNLDTVTRTSKKGSDEYKAAVDKVKVAQLNAKKSADIYRAAALLAGKVVVTTPAGLPALINAWDNVADAANLARRAQQMASSFKAGTYTTPRTGFSAGGTSTGSASGYGVTLHGTEDIISYDPRYREANITRAANALQSLAGGNLGGTSQQQLNFDMRGAVVRELADIDRIAEEIAARVMTANRASGVA